MSGDRRPDRPHICFVSPTIYPVLGQTDLPFVGGAEVQQAIIARALRSAGYGVSVVTRDHGVGDSVTADGIDVLHLPPVAGRGVRGLRWLHPRLTDVVRKLRAIGPDIVYIRSASGYVGACAWFARRHGRRVVYAAAHDDDFMPGRIKGLARHELALFRAGIRCCDAITVQNAFQQELLQRRFGRSGILVPNVFVDPKARDGTPQGVVLWVGTVKPSKRPELFLALAARFPGRRFVMVGGPQGYDERSQEFYRQIEIQASLLANLTFEGHVPFAEVGRYFDQAALLVNTSEAEGFPNTFLQAWLRGIPSLSFVAPVTSTEATGTIACSTIEDMAIRLGALLSDVESWRRAADRARRHFKRFHSLQTALPIYEALFAGSATQARLTDNDPVH